MNRISITAAICFLSGAGLGWYFRDSQEKPPIPTEAVVYVENQEAKVSLVPDGEDVMDSFTSIERLPNVSRVSRARVQPAPEARPSEWLRLLWSQTGL
jgi:hypothetical protein